MDAAHFNAWHARGHAGQDGGEPIRLEIYVADHCRICDYTHEVAAMIQRDFPEVDIQIIDLADPTKEIPEVVFATPTYLLNGQVWSLGNPSLDDVRTRLSRILAR